MIDDLFFSIWRNKYLRKKIAPLSYTQYVIIKNITVLDKKYEYLSLLNHYHVPVVYHIRDLDHLCIYTSHKHNYLITHVIVSASFYKNHLHLLQQQQSPATPILFGISISESDSDSKIIGKELPLSIQYYSNTRLKPLTKDDIPRSVTSLFLGTSNIELGVIPEGVKTLVIDKQGEQIFKFENLPRSLTSLYFFSNTYSNGEKVDFDLLPPNLLSFNLNILDDLDCTGNLPKSLTCLSHNPKIIPDGLVRLNMKSITHLSDYIFPKSLTYLKYNYILFDSQSSKISFPPNLKTLLLDSCPNSILNQDNCPSGILSYSNINYFENFEVPYIPPTATKVYLKFLNEIKELPIIPTSVTHLEIVSKFAKVVPNGYFSNNITKLAFHSDQDLYPGLIPSSVTKLTLTYAKPIQAHVIPSSVKKLSLKGPKVSIELPNSITSLSFENQNQVYSDIVIPNSVTKLKVRNMDFKTFPFHLFKNVTTLSTIQILSNAKGTFEKLFSTTNIKIVKRGDFYYHCINQQLYKEVCHLKLFYLRE
ncbi:hypothetical protein CYY_007195 [Polysphondylium violaceum]|uniref:FNIP repeat-containing protein n=1 Tax=Polysphondylium violaceum TaxID=133409 RepID=A0A8J4PS72_9MYCE|nr:hypothetical protein CYY_007195 [Polysphondylium violaceum]